MIELKGKEKVVSVPNEAPKNPLVSVLVQTYNHEKYISKCLDGILSQRTDFEFEILVGEDESSDSTREICLEYAKRNPEKIRLFLHSRANVIYVSNNPTGRYNLLFNLEHANGKYIALCEGDDYWIDNFKLQKQIDFLNKNADFSFCFHRANVLRENSGIIIKGSRGERLNKKYKTKDVILHLPVYTNSLVFKNELDLPDWFLKIYAGDKFMVLLISLEGFGYCLPDYMAVYRVHEKNITHTWAKKNQFNELKKNIESIDFFDDYTDGKYAEYVRKYKKMLISNYALANEKKKFINAYLQIKHYSNFQSRSFISLKNLIIKLLKVLRT